MAEGETGWFVLNARDAPWVSHERFGSASRLEPPDGRFPEVGLNIRVLRPGQANGLYHRENAQEDFLVLRGECLLIVEDEERSLRAWDFAHLPAGTDHILVGAGDGPCLVLMTGARPPDHAWFYPESEVAQRHGVGVETETASGAEAYADTELPRPGRPPDLDSLLD